MQTDPPSGYIDPTHHSRIWVIGVSILAVVIILFVLVLKYSGDGETLTIKPGAGYTVSVGTPSNGESGLGISKVLVKTTLPKQLHLQKGYYVALFTKNNSYIPVYQNVNLDRSLTLASPPLDYTNQKLSALLAQQSPAIHAAFQGSSSGLLLGEGYTIQDIGLYDDGSWYAGRLTPSNTTQDDLLVFIMHWQAGQWQLAATPAITLYIGDYLNIPTDVIRAANVSPIGSSLPY